MIRRLFSSPRVTSSPQQILELANLHLENARKTKDREVALDLCNDAEAALSRITKTAKKTLKTPLSVEDQALRNGVAASYLEHGNLLESLGHVEKAKLSYKKAEKLGLVKGIIQPPSGSSQLGNKKEMISLSAIHHSASPLSLNGSQADDLAHIPPSIFTQNVDPAVAKYPLPKAGARLE
ncbi:hypothetical protein BGZ99_000363, partial [Dissophora globulifera]